MQERPSVVLTSPQMGQLRERYQRTLEAARLMRKLERPELADEFDREARAMRVPHYYVAHPCLVCREPVHIEMRPMDAGLIEAVICGRCASMPHDDEHGRA